MYLPDGLQGNEATNADVATGSGIAPESSGDPGNEPPQTTMSAIGEKLLLISPFFFWGTSMVSMKVCLRLRFPSAPSTA